MVLESAKFVSVVAVVVGVHGVQPPPCVEAGGDHDQDSDEVTEAWVVVGPITITLSSSTTLMFSSLEKKEIKTAMILNVKKQFIYVVDHLWESSHIVYIFRCFLTCLENSRKHCRCSFRLSVQRWE